MNRDHHAAAMSALSEIQGVLSKHGRRKPDADDDTVDSSEATEGLEADEAINDIMSTDGEIATEGDDDGEDSVADAIARADMQEIESQPIRVTSYNRPRSATAPAAKRGPGRPRKY